MKCKLTIIEEHLARTNSPRQIVYQAIAAWLAKELHK